MEFSIIQSLTLIILLLFKLTESQSSAQKSLKSQQFFKVFENCVLKFVTKLNSRRYEEFITSHFHHSPAIVNGMNISTKMSTSSQKIFNSYVDMRYTNCYVGVFFLHDFQPESSRSQNFVYFINLFIKLAITSGDIMRYIVYVDIPENGTNNKILQEVINYFRNTIEGF